MFVNKNLAKFIKLATIVGCCSAAQAFEPFIVEKIEVRGLKQVSRDAVLLNMPISVGAEISPNDTSKILHDLHDSGLFENVSLLRDGNDLIVDVQERPIINNLTVSGVSGKKEILDILRELQVANGFMYDADKLESAIDAIEKHYIGKGNFAVNVDKKITFTKNGVNVAVEIYEGSQAKVRSIGFIGNKTFKDAELKKQLLHQTSSLFSWYTKSDVYVREKLLADIEAIRSFYMDNGYINVDVSSADVSLSPDRKYIYITFRINEGEQFNFGALTVSGDFVIPKSEFENIISKNITTDKPFSRMQLMNVKKEMEDKLGVAGFSKAEVRLLVDSNEEKNTINIDFHIVPNKRVMVRKISFNGNDLTKDSVLRRNVQQDEATWISTKEIELGREAIERSGLAKNVSVKTKDVIGKEDQVDVEYNLEEQKSTKLAVGVQYSSAEKLVVNASAELSNFLGTGKDIDFIFERSKSFKHYAFGYFNPHFYSTNLGFGYNFYYNKSQLSKTSDVFAYTNNNLGGKVFWSLPLSRYSRFIIDLGVDRTKISLSNRANEPVEVTNFINSNGQKYKEWYAALAWNYNSLDRYIFPTKGTSASISGKYVLPWSDLKYYKLDYKHNWYKPVYGDVVFNLSGRVGFANKYGNSQYYPFFRHYFLGGPETVRGFEDRSLGPKDSGGKEFGGNFLVNLRTSLITPPPYSDLSSSVRFSAFVDAGQVYDTIQRTRIVNGVSQARNPTGIRASVGVATTWFSPLGVPIEFSVATPIKKRDGDKLRAVSYSLGVQF